MKRSEINQILKSAKAFMAEKQFILPPWAYWSVDDWKKTQRGCFRDYRKHAWMGYYRFWLRRLLFTGDCFCSPFGMVNLMWIKKPYAEKIMIVEENQETPMHYHWSKMEDIINRGGVGNLVIELYNTTTDNQLDTTPVLFKIDSVKRSVPAGGKVILTPGESICLEQGMYHRFYGESGKGKVLVGEVSAVNDDNSDNCFHQPVGRFPVIEGG